MDRRLSRASRIKLSALAASPCSAWRKSWFNNRWVVTFDSARRGCRDGAAVDSLLDVYFIKSLGIDLDPATRHYGPRHRDAASVYCAAHYHYKKPLPRAYKGRAASRAYSAPGERIYRDAATEPGDITARHGKIARWF